jgi:hypothetical protein
MATLDPRPTIASVCFTHKHYAFIFEKHTVAELHFKSPHRQVGVLEQDVHPARNQSRDLILPLEHDELGRDAERFRKELSYLCYYTAWFAGFGVDELLESEVPSCTYSHDTTFKHCS